MLIVQGDSQDNILRESISTQGYYELNLDGLLFSSDANSSHYTQELAGATRETVKALSFNGGLGHDRLILDRQNLNQALHITADDEVDIQGNITSKSDIQITADQIKLNAKIKANSVIFNAANVLNQGEIKTKSSTDITFSDRYIDTSLSVISGKKINITGGTTGNLETRSKFVAKEISLLGNQVSLLGANLDATSKSGGGTVLIGGDYQGKGVERGIVNAMNTVVDKNTVIRADALSNGNGGKVIIWSDQKTIFEGSVSTQGGSISGDGGFVEVSGKHQLNFAGQVDMSATNGKLGTLLIDPDDYYIGPNDGDKNTFDISDLEKIKGNLFFSAANNVTFNASANFVSSRGTITIQADSDGDGIGTVSLNGDFSSGGRSIDISGANVSTRGLYSGGNIGGGFINITAKNTISAGGVYSNVAVGNGGNVTLISQNGNIDFSQGNIYTTTTLGNGGKAELHAYKGRIIGGRVQTGANSGNGGKIILDALQDITVEATNSSSFAKNAGIIEVTSTEGNIDFGTGIVQANSKQGNAGSITLIAKSTTNNRTITSGLIDTGADGNGNGGAITLTTQGDIFTSAVVTNSNGTGKSGKITITSTAGGINTTNDSPDTSDRHIFTGAYLGGTGGAVTLDAYGDIVTRTIFAGSSTGIGNTVKLTSQTGGIDTGDGYITTATNGGNGGTVILTAVKDIKVDNIDSGSTASGKAGRISLTTTTGGIEVKNLSAGSVQGDGNTITLTSALGVTTQNLNTKSGGNAGNVTVIAVNDVNMGNIESNSTVSGRGGTIELTTNGNIVTNGIQAQSNGVGSGGTVKVTSLAGKIEMNGGQVSTHASNNGTGGKVTLVANQTIAVGEINTYASFGRAGEVILTANGDITTTTIYASAAGASGNNVTLTSVNGGINTNDLEISATSLSGGSAGKVTLTAAKDIKVGDIFARSREEVTGVWNGGRVTLEAGAAIKVGSVTTTSFTGNAGNVVLTAANDIEAGAIKANVFGNGTGIGGAVKFVSQLGSISTEYVRTDSVGAKGGNITLDAGSKISGGAGGNVKVTGAFDVDGAEVSLFAGIRDGVAINVKHHAQTFDVGDATENGTKGLIMSASGLVVDSNIDNSFTLGSLINNLAATIKIQSSAPDTSDPLTKSIDNLIDMSFNNEFNRLAQEVFQQVYDSLLVLFGGGTSSKLSKYVDQISTLEKAKALTKVAALEDSLYKTDEAKKMVAQFALPNIENLLASSQKFSVTDKAQIAYIIATVSHESFFGIQYFYNPNPLYGRNYTGKALYEYSNKGDFGSDAEVKEFQDAYGTLYGSNNASYTKIINGKSVSFGGYAFRGRGYVQLTHHDNYKKFQTELKNFGYNLDLLGFTANSSSNPGDWMYGADIVANDRNLAADIAVYGMKTDLFFRQYPSTTEVFGGYLKNTTDANKLTNFQNARALVNSLNGPDREKQLVIADDIAKNAIAYFDRLNK
jgi:predicted chitinase